GAVHVETAVGPAGVDDSRCALEFVDHRRCAIGVDSQTHGLLTGPQFGARGCEAVKCNLKVLASQGLDKVGDRSALDLDCDRLRRHFGEILWCSDDPVPEGL